MVSVSFADLRVDCKTYKMFTISNQLGWTAEIVAHVIITQTYLKVAFETSQLVKRPDKALIAKHQRNMLIFNGVCSLITAAIAICMVVSGFRTWFYFVIAWSIFLFLTSLGVLWGWTLK